MKEAHLKLFGLMTITVTYVSCISWNYLAVSYQDEIIMDLGKLALYVNFGSDTGSIKNEEFYSSIVTDADTLIEQRPEHNNANSTGVLVSSKEA